MQHTKCNSLSAAEYQRILLRKYLEKYSSLKEHR
jgi:hypothetical protein